MRTRRLSLLLVVLSVAATALPACGRPHRVRKEPRREQVRVFEKKVVAAESCRCAPAPAAPRAPARAEPEPRARAGDERGYLGVAIANAADAGGVEITRIRPGTPAARAGLKPGDVIVAVDGERVSSMTDAAAAIQRKRPGDGIVLDVERKGWARKVDARLAARPPEHRIQIEWAHDEGRPLRLAERPEIRVRCPDCERRRGDWRGDWRGDGERRPRDAHAAERERAEGLRRGKEREKKLRWAMERLERIEHALRKTEKEMREARREVERLQRAVKEEAHRR